MTTAVKTMSTQPTTAETVAVAVPVAMREGYEPQLQSYLATTDMKPPSDAIMLDDRVRDKSSLFDVINGVAFIPVSGVLVDSVPWISRWWTGYNVLSMQFDEAFVRDDVKSIVMCIKSPGGLVSGLMDLVDEVAEGRAATGKEIVAICDDHAYSAAYAIASVADQITVPRTGGVGSIGVVMLHMSFQKMLQDIGIEATYVKSGARKTDGNPFEPLGRDVLARFQQEIDDLRDLFAETVSRNRTAAGRDLSVEDVLQTEAAIFDGPKGTAEAVSLGLADIVAAPKVVLDAVLRQTTAPG